MYGIGYTHNNASFIPAGTGWGMYVTDNGYVGSFLSGYTGNSYVMGNWGVGTNTPATKLHVYDGGDLLRVSRSGDTALLEIGYNGQGNNSVTTTTATIKFGSAAGDANYEHCVIENREYSASEHRELLLFSGNDGVDRIRLATSSYIAFDTYTNNTTDRGVVNTRMTVHRNGYVSIGTTADNKNAKFWVEGTGPNASVSYRYMNSSATGTYGPVSMSYSIGCSGRIRCSEFNAISDERKKKDFVEILDNTALDLVNQLKVYNFK